MVSLFLLLAGSSFGGEALLPLPPVDLPASNIELAFHAIFPKIAVHDSWLFAESRFPQFSVDELARAVHAKSTSPLILYLGKRFSEETMALMGSHNVQLVAALEARTLVEKPERFMNNLQKELNDIIKGEIIYDEKLFSGIHLQFDTRELLAARKQNEFNPRLNRLLLEDAFPRIFFKKSERVLADAGSPFVVHLDNQRGTVQFYDEKGVKGLFMDLVEMNHKDQYFEENPLLNGERFSGDIFKVHAGKQPYEIHVKDQKFLLGDRF